MAFQRIATRTLPDGSTRKVYPFHLSLQGMKTTLLCKTDADYDHLEKSIYLSAYKNNALVIIAIAMSNHAHICLLAPRMENAFSTGEDIKKRHSQYLSRIYSEHELLRRTRINVQYLDSEWYVRNALAYVARNALDCGTRVEDYKWSGYKGMFVGGKVPSGSIRVADLGRRARNAIFATHLDLSHVPWVINQEGRVEPVSSCDYAYLESAFANDQAFFLKTIGSLNPLEMQQKLVINGSVLQTDSQMITIIENLSEKWFDRKVSSLTPEMKARLVFYLYRTYRTSSAQLARCLKMLPDIVDALIHRS